jgi:hypothetical protein
MSNLSERWHTVDGIGRIAFYMRELEVSPQPCKEAIRLDQLHTTVCMLVHAATLFWMHNL